LQEKETTKANGQGCCRALNRTKSKRGVFLGFFCSDAIEDPLWVPKEYGILNWVFSSSKRK